MREMREMRGAENKRENLKQVFSLVPNSPCPQVLLPIMPHAPYPIQTNNLTKAPAATFRL
jgi:hypothetical protein